MSAVGRGGVGPGAQPGHGERFNGVAPGRHPGGSVERPKGFVPGLPPASREPLAGASAVSPQGSRERPDGFAPVPHPENGEPLHGAASLRHSGSAGHRDDAAPGPLDRISACPNRGLAWAELLRLPALFTVPGDALAGAAATGAHPNARTVFAIGSSLCLYEAGMALNDWADREEDAAERPHRPLPSGRIRPAAALTAACALTGAGLTLAARAGRPALAVAVPLTATVWAYDLTLKHTPVGPVAMAAARGLDLLLGAAATTGHTREALASAALLGTHTLAVTTVSRQEAQGGSPLAPLAALVTAGLLTRLVTRRRSLSSDGPSDGPSDGLSEGLSEGLWEAAARGLPDSAFAVGSPPGTVRAAGAPAGATPAARAQWADTGADTDGAPGTRAMSGTEDAAAGVPGVVPGAEGVVPATASQRPVGRAPTRFTATDALRTALGAVYAATVARPYTHALLNPSPPLTQRAVGGGIRATVPLQAALSARSGAGVTALAIAALAPIGSRFARKVSVT